MREIRTLRVMRRELETGGSGASPSYRASSRPYQEIEISLFARQYLGKRRIPDLGLLQRESQAWNRQMNRARVRIDWKFSRKDARRKFGYKKNYFRGSRT